MQSEATARPFAPAAGDIRRLLIVRLSAMGDIIHALPAAAALRNAFPEALLGWVIEERWAELLCTLQEPRSGPRSPQRPLVDRIHTVNTSVWRSSLLSTQTWEGIAAGLSELRATTYEVVVDLQSAVRSALIAKMSGAPVIYGVAQPRENAASMFYTRQVIAGGTHIIEQNLSLAQAVAGRPISTPKVQLPYDENAEVECDLRLKALGIRDFVVLNPGAGWGAKQWPPERYGEVAKQLAACGVRALINFGPGEEDLVHAVEGASGGTATGIACSLTLLIALTRRARLFIGGDTGPLHLAAALEIPVVAIFGPTNPARNGPFGARSIVLRSPSSTTTHARLARPEEGLLEISADEVVGAARELLGGSRG